MFKSRVAARRLVEALLRLAPDDFRTEYERELLATLEDQLADNSRPGKSDLTGNGASASEPGGAGFWGAQIVAVFRLVVWLRWQTLRSAVGSIRPLETLQAVGRDLTSARRSLAAQPGLTLFSVLTLGLGIGATTAMFSTVNGILLRELPYANASDVVIIRQTDTRDGSLREGISAANVHDLARWSRQGTKDGRPESDRPLLEVALANPHGFTLLEEGRAQSLRSWTVSEGFFEALGEAPQLGRTFLQAEYDLGSEQVVVLSHETWQSRFAGSVEVLGRELVLDDVVHRIVGVMPPRFKFPTATELWSPRPRQTWDDDFRSSSRMLGIARMVPDISDERREAVMQSMAVRLAEEHPATNAYLGLHATPLRGYLLADVENSLLLLLGVVVLVLFVAAANVAGLQLARDASRQRDAALRGALGASTFQVVRVAVVEGLCLAVLGGAVGAALAWLSLALLQGFGTGVLPRLEELQLDARVFGFAVVVSLASALLASLVPALRASRLASRSRFAVVLRGSSKTSTSAGQRVATRDRLVIAEIAVAVVLTIGAGLLVRSLDRLLDTDLGIDPTGRVAVQVFAYDSDHAPNREYFDRGLREVGAIPGVTAVGLTTSVPLADGKVFWSGAGSVRYSVGGATSSDASVPEASLLVVNSGYAGALGIELRAGRVFGLQDHEDSAPVVMVNEAFVRQLAGQSGSDGAAEGSALRRVIGRRIQLLGNVDSSKNASPGRGETLEIVGVLADVRSRGFSAVPEPEVYRNLSQTSRGSLTFVVHSEVDSEQLAAAVRDVLWTVDPGQAIWAAQPMSDLLWGWNRQRRFQTVLWVAFAALAVVLASIGIYGFISFSVEQRTTELGVRSALGGSQRVLIGMVLKRGLVLACWGVGIGLLAAAGLSRLLAGMVHEISVLDPLTFVGLSVGVLAVALASIMLPALRASRIDPVDALRGG